MRQDNMHRALMNSAIHVVSEQGIHKATTKALAQNSGVNEAYIYRLFSGKEDLLKQTFADLDNQLVRFLSDLIDDYQQRDTDAEQAIRDIVLDLWHFILSDCEKCQFFIRYYYSQHFLDYSVDERRQAYLPIIERLQPMMLPDVDVWEEINHVYDVLFPTAARVLRGELQNNAALEKTILRRLQAFLLSMLRSSDTK